MHLAVCVRTGLWLRNIVAYAVIFLTTCLPTVYAAPADDAPSTQNAPGPLLKKGQPVDWWFVFKFNTKSFPQCGPGVERQCLFGGDARTYKQGFGQQYVYASSEAPALQKGGGCVGASLLDPVSATFDQVYNSSSTYYVVWNDQFLEHPIIPACTKGCSAPWGHSKGMLAWNDAGEGLVMQVSTPSWPGAASASHPRKDDGNTLGCVNDDNVLVSQHFFSLKLNQVDVMQVLGALGNASVVTDVSNPQLVRNGGPHGIQTLVARLGAHSSNVTMTKSTLSSNVILISKPSKLHVPPWQMVSAALGSASLRTATWWAAPKIDSTKAGIIPGCWDPALAAPGAVEIAEKGHWNGVQFGLTGMTNTDFNHAKIGVSTDGNFNYAIFGDMNQQGALSGNCNSSQNGRGGLFFVIANKTLSDGIRQLIDVAK